ncbi:MULTISPECIES: hypothetical protein [Halorussus]|uniref:DUF7344 domain-containing protein n=1 Tax=Halorussus TaxID=1070314 RepID=UPI000E210507|nr:MULTISPECIES: hypothetical protein [Halorussus]NHN59121.1 hypothetical protein [Halorussus sp. JP-T4]
MMNSNAPDVTDGRAGGGRGVSPALDAALDLLSNRRRRYVLYHLRNRDGAVTLDELAERVASWEGDSGESGDESRVLADLYHSQLPRLADAGAITFDEEEGFVTLADGDDAPLAEYLDIAAREENVA